jgi:aminopeptidase N
MQWWDDLWLNEGFATWMANRPLAALHPEWNIPVAEELETQTALNSDSLQSTRPVHAGIETPAQIDEAFDVIAYEKGAAVLRMIESYVGPETFRAGINAYLQAHAYANVKSEDFWNAIAAVSGKPVDRIMPTFINQPGVPLLDVSMTCDGTRTKIGLSQQRFFADDAPRQTKSSEQWDIPLCVRTPDSTAPSCDVLAEKSRALTLSGGSCAPWVFANSGAEGYFRSAYPPAMLRAIAPEVETKLSAPERLSLIADEWALVRAGRHTAADYLALVSGYGRESSSGVLAEVVNRLEFIHDYWTTDATRPRFEEFVRSLFQPVLAELGASTSSTDSDERRERREVLLRALGTIGNDIVVVRNSREMLDRTLNGGPALDSTLEAAIVRVAAEHGDEALREKLLAAARRSTSPEDHYRYLNATGQFRDPALIDRGLELALTPDIRNQDTAIYLGGFLRNPVARPRAWSFVKQHWTELEPKVTIFGGDTNLIKSLNGFCDAASRDDIKAFFAAHPLPAAARTLSQTIERIDNCVALKEKQTRAVEDWLSRQSKSGA